MKGVPFSETFLHRERGGQLVGLPGLCLSRVNEKRPICLFVLFFFAYKPSFLKSMFVPKL